MEWNSRTLTVTAAQSASSQREAASTAGPAPGLRVARYARRTAASTWYASLLACVIVAGSALIVAMIIALVFTG